MVVAGFVGAGKTTAILQFAHSLRSRNITSAVITNDHGSELVDNTLYRAEGITNEAIEGGDFCTQAEETLRAAGHLHKEGAQIIFAEPAGTCADLNEMLLAPARSALGQDFAIAPLTVIVDPIRAARVLELEPGGKLTSGIATLYRRQLSEAELIVINKSDAVSPAALSALYTELSKLAPQATIFTASAETGTGLADWFECVMTRESSRPNDVKAAVPAPGSEALLAWLNCTVAVSSVRYFEAGKLLLDLASSFQSLLHHEGGQIAHLKIGLRPEFDGYGMAAVSLARFDASPQLLRNVSEPIQRGELILNARAMADPEILHSVVNRALLALMEKSPELFARMHHCEHFKAGLSCQQPSLAAD